MSTTAEELARLRAIEAAARDAVSIFDSSFDEGFPALAELRALLASPEETTS